MNATVEWVHNRINCSAIWRSLNDEPPPKNIVSVNDRITTDTALKLLKNNKTLLWNGDYYNALQILKAIKKRLDSKCRRCKVLDIESFLSYRALRSIHSTYLHGLLIPIDSDYSISLPRSPDVSLSCRETYHCFNGISLISLQELLGVISAHEWRKNGIFINFIKGKIHPHYNVFSPIRNDYIDLMVDTDIPRNVKTAIDIGTGTGVLSIILAKKGIKHIIATDISSAAIDCATQNIASFQLSNIVSIKQASLFPDTCADLVVCNPPWIPATISTAADRAIFDQDSTMLRGFISGLSSHLLQNGEGWLILSDFAEIIGLRTRVELLSWIDKAGLVIKSKFDIKPSHKKVLNTEDPLHCIRSKEVTSLWCLKAK